MKLFIDRFEGFVRHVAKHTYLRSNVADFDDLCQAGRMAIVKAVPKYDVSFGASFDSYVRTSIRRAIFREAGLFCHIFRVPSGVLCQASTVHHMSLDGKDDQEIAKQLGITLGLVRDLKSLYATHQSSINGIQPSCNDFNIAPVLADLSLSPQEQLILQQLQQPYNHRILVTLLSEQLDRSYSSVDTMIGELQRKIVRYLREE